MIAVDIIDLQLREHFPRVPVPAQRFYLSVFVHFEHIDAFEIYLLAIRARPLPGPLHRGAISGDEDLVLGQRDALEVLAD